MSAAALALAFVAPPLALPGSPEDEGPDVEIEPLRSPAGAPSGMPDVVRGADGRVYLSWLELQGRTSATLRFSVLLDDAWSEPRTIARGANWFVNWTDFASLAALADGTLVAHWLERLGEETYAYGAMFALSTDGGETWSTPRLLHDDASPAEHGFVSFAPLDDATFGALWLDGRAAAGHGAGDGATRLYFRTVAKSGELGEEELVDERVCDCCPTALVRVADGELVALWRDRSEDEVRDVSFARRSALGWTKPATLAPDGWKIPGCPVNGPRLAFDTGALAAAWYTGAGGGAGRVLAGVFEGDALGSRVQVDDGAPAGRVELATLDGDPVVCWLEVEAGRGEWRLRVLPSSGPASRSITLAEVSADRDSGLLRMARDERGLVAAWRDTDSSSVRTARLLSAD